MKEGGGISQTTDSRGPWTQTQRGDGRGSGAQGGGGQRQGKAGTAVIVSTITRNLKKDLVNLDQVELINRTSSWT